jgi:flagellar basal-body rod protein FlgB
MMESIQGLESVQGAGARAVKLALDAAALRHQAIAHNLANLGSENYVPLGVSFESQLGAARDARLSRPELVQDLSRGVGPRPQDVDSEMVKLAQNTIHYQALTRALGKVYAMLRETINEGKR